MKTTKRALFSSVIALILCFSMLVGTTFAWFTDEVKSDVNKIVAGNLDVDVVTTADDKSIENQSVLFDEIKLWEPGVVAYENITVKNLGTLALKYQLSVNFDKENYVVEADGTVTDNCLADVLMVSVIEETIDAALSREKVLTKAGEGVLLSELVKSGELESLKNQNYAIIIWWPQSTNDDTFNINNGKTTTDGEALHINLGLKVLATQLDANIEQDSFGPDYDEDAIYTDFTVTSEAELKEALANGKDDMIIGIKGNVTWTTGAGIGSTPFVGEDSSIKKITLLGLTEDATFTALGSGVGEIGIDGGTVTFKNLKIVDESVSYAENSWEYGYLEFRGNTVFENCDVVNAIMMEGDSATFVNCSFNSHDDNQYAVWVSEGDATFENCYITGARGIKVHEAYGSKVGTVVIKNNQFIDLTKKPGLAIGDVDADTTVVVQKNTFAGTQAGDQGNYMYETDTAVTIFDFVCADNMVAGYADTNAELKDQLQNNATVILPEGEYSLPTLSGKEGITIIGAADGSTVIGGENTSTGFGGNFGKKTTIKNVTFSGTTNGVRSSYAQGGTTIFENCTFAGDSTYGFHIDQSNGATFIFNNCTFIGFNAFAGDLEKVVFNNCTFKSNGYYGHTNIWSVAEFNNCTFENATFGPRGDAKIYIDGTPVVYTAEALASMLTSDAEEINVMLGENIDLPINSLGQQTGGSGEYKLGGENTKAITIDLNGNKLNITTGYWSGIGAKNDDAIFTIKNGTMTSSQATGTWNSYDVTFANCNYVIENVVFEKAIAFTNAGKNVKLTNVTINETHDYYALWISAKGQNVVINGLTVNSAGRGIKIDEQYVDAPAKVTLNISNAKFTTAKKAAVMVKSVEGAEIILNNVDITGVAADATNAVWVDGESAAHAGKVTVNGAPAVIEP